MMVEGTTATDLVLKVMAMLRKKGVTAVGFSFIDIYCDMVGSELLVDGACQVAQRLYRQRRHEAGTDQAMRRGQFLSSPKRSNPRFV